MNDIIETEFRNPKRLITHHEKDTIVSNKNLIHLTSKFERLTGILKNGFRSNLIKEFPVHYKDYKEINDLLVVFGIDKPKTCKVEIPMVCFSDIPRKAIKMHMSNYGFYGLSISKDWAIENRISPVFYIKEDTKTHELFANIYGTLKHAKNLENEELLNYSALIRNLRELESFIKLYQDNNNYKFYDEREWRYIPNENFDKDKTETYLKLDYDKIQNVYVKTSKEKKIVTELIRENFSCFDAKRVRLSRK